MIKKQIPNAITCLNLLCGCIGIVYAFTDLTISSYMIFLACVFDFLDGFAARLLKVSSPIGKELDSLADVVTFGVLPGLIVYHLLTIGLMNKAFAGTDGDASPTPIAFAFIAFSISIFSAVRLAVFNIDTRQSESFLGLPTPANALFFASFPLILSQYPNSVINNYLINPYILIGLSLCMSYMLVSGIPLFALKFKSFSWRANKIKYIFLICSASLFIILNVLSIPIIIFLYIILSIAENKLNFSS
jgi:CDP-diacylglycerol--serine O-phosphatidyltransferase